MAILILNRFRASMCKFSEWLAPLNEELYVFMPELGVADFLAQGGYALVKGFDDYRNDGLVEIEALRLHRERPFRAVIALDEADVMRAARIRERLGLPGQHVESATAFRDKVVMKTLLAPHVKCPAFARLTEPFDLHDFVETHGLPVVVKPDDGMGSMNTQVVRTQEQLDSVYRQGQ
ncbi:MAG: ATP-grasp domain-containing protein, partial [Tumebacillaceae bacterium]